MLPSHCSPAATTWNAARDDCAVSPKPLGEPGFVCLSRESLSIGKRPRKTLKTLKVVFDMEAINFNANINNETVPELPPEQKSRNLYEDRGSSLDPYCELTHSLQLSFFHFFKYS